MPSSLLEMIRINACTPHTCFTVRLVPMWSLIQAQFELPSEVSASLSACVSSAVQRCQRRICPAPGVPPFPADVPCEPSCTTTAEGDSWAEDEFSPTLDGQCLNEIDQA